MHKGTGKKTFFVNVYLIYENQSKNIQFIVAPNASDLQAMGKRLPWDKEVASKTCDSETIEKN